MDWYCAECGKKIAKPLPEYEYHNYDYQREEIEGGKQCSVCGRSLCGDCAEWYEQTLVCEDPANPICKDCLARYGEDK